MCSNLVPGSVKRHWYIIEFSLMTNSTLLYHYNIWMCLHLIAKSYWLISASDSFSVGRHRIICANSFHWCVYPHLGHHNLLAITSAHHFLLWLQILQQFPRSYRVSSSDLPQLFHLALSSPILLHSSPSGTFGFFLPQDLCTSVDCYLWHCSPGIHVTWSQSLYSRCSQLLVFVQMLSSLEDLCRPLLLNMRFFPSWFIPLAGICHPLINFLITSLFLSPFLAHELKEGIDFCGVFPLNPNRCTHWWILVRWFYLY